MSNDIDIKKLSNLGRIDLDEAKVEELTKNITEVLAYVGSVQEVVGTEDDSPAAGVVRNVLREDTDPHDPEAYREALLREAPATDADGFIIVPPILAR